MDLKQYFRKIRQVEAGLSETFPLVVSLETPDGGKPGLVSEISREQAAKMIVEGRALLASEEEKELYREQQARAKDAAEKAELAKRVQVAIISDRDLTHQIEAKVDHRSPTER
jgi:coenzyme F420-reducing hydrogenase alpha subunit